MHNRKIILKGIITAIIVCILGFGVMNIFWIFNTNLNLPGLYYYKAASIGDSIFLPILVGACIVYLSYKERINSKQILISHIIGALFGVGAAIEQLRWLRNDEIVLNWTIPEAHKFNAAGWYHAVFL